MSLPQIRFACQRDASQMTSHHLVCVLAWNALDHGVMWQCALKGLVWEHNERHHHGSSFVALQILYQVHHSDNVR
jgi:hypothetical protein